MLSVKSLGLAGSGVEEYYEHLAQDDYYENGGEPPGRWQGTLAQSLFLFGDVRPGQLGLMFRGYHPLTGDALATNAGDDHKVGWDLTFSAPKSVSMVWAFSSAEVKPQIEAAHDKAVYAALKYLEQRAFSSRDRGQNSQGVKAILAASYQHGTSRELDPQLHTHAAVANIGMRADGSHCALDFDTRYKMAGGAVYRAELAAQLKQLGYVLERDGRSFKVTGVDKSLCEKFSKRRSQIVERLQQTGYSSAKAASIAALNTRPAKELTDRQSLFKAWKEEAETANIDLTMFNDRQLLQQSIDAEHRVFAIDIDAILVGLTAQASTFTRAQLEAAIAVECQGVMGASQIQQVIKEAVAAKTMERGKHGMVRLYENSAHASASRRQTERFTTRELLAIEQDILTRALARQGEMSHVVVNEALVDHSSLSKEQAKALLHITQESGAVKAVRGLAGTGKSFLLRAARESWDSSGLSIVGLALSGKAAQSLEEGSGIPSQTIHSLLGELTRGQRVLSRTDVVVIDEAGMIGSRQLHNVLGHVHEAGAKAVLVGDPLQLQPIDAGGIFRALSDKLGYASLEDIRRQSSAEDRANIQKLISGHAEHVLQNLLERNMLTSVPAENVHSVIVTQWMKDLKPDAMHQALMLAGTRHDVYMLNILARQSLLEQARLHSEVSVKTAHGERAMAVGERVMFTRNDRKLAVKNGETGTLKKWELDRKGNVKLEIHNDNGKKVSVSMAEYDHLDYGYALSVHKAQGQTVDNVYLLISESMTDREWAYVGVSRHREQLRVYCQEEVTADISALIAASHQKEVTQDYSFDGDTAFGIQQLEEELGE